MEVVIKDSLPYHYYLVRTTDGAGGANGFAVGAPAALFFLYYLNDIADQDQSLTPADADTETAPVTFLRVK